MNLLLLNIYFHPDPTGTGLVMTELASGLAQRGHQVTAVTSFPHYGKDRLPERYRGRIIERDWHGGVRVLRTYVHVSPKRDTVHRLINYASFAASSAVAGVAAGPFDVVFACSPPLTTGVVGWLVACVKGAPLVFNTQDIYPDVAVKLGLINSRRVIRAMTQMERFIYQRSARVAVISAAGRRSLLGKGVPREQIDVIENWADTELLRPTGAGSFREQHGLHGKQIVMYSGNVGLVHGLTNVVDCAKLMSDVPDLAFAIVGEGNGKTALRRHAAEQDVTNVRFLPTQPRAQFAGTLASADICLVTLGKGMSTSSVPSKTYSIMAAGRPILAAVDPGSEIWELVERAECGVCVPPDEPLTLKDAISDMLRDSTARERMGRAGREYVVRYNSREAQVDRYERMLLDVVRTARIG